ncbi:uncharacterized protein B0I36DRAFT_137169 [Microdochium trichocladiopsis]|uniref:Uncharacterized protein n=1 Tax=Microdochium trichocladiopsis TaxID=1682393 RepID=A0A9P8Y1C6_9PEZI|nr:uncharacterized protein B0I36DRAFT_137169 [Microdochium trichocladiopsis]KAH7027301.1 hypothetical protein B0I36DRAFT_137169 [Microdochium trichocladiopsis]
MARKDRVRRIGSWAPLPRHDDNTGGEHKLRAQEFRMRGGVSVVPSPAVWAGRRTFGKSQRGLLT